MKTLLILALTCAAAVAASVPSSVAPVETSNPVVPSSGASPSAKPGTNTRNGRYILLTDGGVLDAVYQVVVPLDAEYVVQRGAGGNREVYIKTVPLRTVRTEYVVTTV